MLQIIVGGDINERPTSNLGGKNGAYGIIRYGGNMMDSEEDQFHKLERGHILAEQGLGPRYATNGNARNSFTSGEKGQIIDYIFHKSNSNNTITWTKSFEILESNFTTQYKGKTISLSDHSPVMSIIHIHWNKSARNYSLHRLLVT